MISNKLVRTLTLASLLAAFAIPPAFTASAIHEGRLVLNCQRIVPIASGFDPALLPHYEILLTAQDDLGRWMAPREFIAAAETYHRITVIDRWVIGKVFEWMADHRNELGYFDGFAVNVSGHSINDDAFPEFVLEQLSRTRVPAGKVCFEITETVAIASLGNARQFMNRMKGVGCRFSLDDFGTGFSSYSYLRNLPVDFVKIDGVFVKTWAPMTTTTRWCARSTRSRIEWAKERSRSSWKTTAFWIEYGKSASTMRRASASQSRRASKNCASEAAGHARVT